VNLNATRLLPEHEVGTRDDCADCKAYEADAAERASRATFEDEIAAARLAFYGRPDIEHRSDTDY
jgi:hypothetical protein